MTLNDSRNARNIKHKADARSEMNVFCEFIISLLETEYFSSELLLNNNII